MLYRAWPILSLSTGTATHSVSTGAKICLMLQVFRQDFKRAPANTTYTGQMKTETTPFHSINLHSGYKWAGFNMGAYFTTGDAHKFPR